MSEPDEMLVRIGWYCWQCQRINSRACRSDNPPIYTTVEWAGEMRDEVMSDD